MSNFSKQLQRYATDTKMSAAEKRELKARVVSYMEYHPRVEKVAAQKAQAYIESQPYSVWQLSTHYLRYGLGAFAVFIFVVLPAVAERAVPGDVLYPFKVNVNEEIRGSLTFSQTDKIEWETERLERRIAEVRLLESEGKLTDEVEAQAVEAVQAHAKAAQEGINELKETDSDEASLAEVAFSSALEVQSAVLENSNTKSASPTALTATGLVADENELARVVREAQVQADASRGTTTPSYDKTMARIERETTRAYELFESLEEVMSDQEKKEMERRFADIERKIALGQDESGTVTKELLVALADTRKLISFMTDIDVRSSVALDRLIPVTLTDEERAFAVAEHIVAVDRFINEWPQFAESDDFAALDEGTQEKLTYGVSELESQLQSFKEATSTPIAEKEIAASNMYTFMSDLQSLSHIGAFETDEPLEGEDVASTTAPGIPDAETGSSTSTTTETTASADGDNPDNDTANGETTGDQSSTTESGTTAASTTATSTTEANDVDTDRATSSETTGTETSA